MKGAASLRIGVFMDALVFGAAPTIAREEVRNLRNLGLDASLLLIKRGTDNYDDELRDFSVEFLEDQSAILSRSGLRMPGFSFFSAFHLLAPILSVSFSLKYDFLITHGTYTCFTAVSLKRSRGIRYVAYVYDPISYILPHVYSNASLRYALPVLKTLGSRMDSIITNSSEAVILLSRYHLTAIKKMTNKPVHIVYPGTEVANRIPNERGDYLLAVARWEPGKKPFFLLDILKDLKKNGVRTKLMVVGSWKTEALRNEFVRQVRLNGLEDYIVLGGAVKRSELLKLYLGSRALVVPDVTAFGMIALEAAAHGAPIIVPKGSGVTDLFKSEVHGFFPSEGDTEAYSSCLAKLITGERLAWNMGYRAWEEAKAYTWRNHAENLSSALQTVI